MWSRFSQFVAATPQSLLVTLLVATVIGMAILSTVMLLAFRWGKQSGVRSQWTSLDRLPTEMDLERTEWTVVHDLVNAAGVRHRQRAWVRFRQFGNRVVGEGEDEEGRRLSLEGAVCRRTLTCLYLEHRRTGQVVGSLHAELDQSGAKLTGLRTVAGEARTMLIQNVSLQLLVPATAASETIATNSPELLPAGNS